MRIMDNAARMLWRVGGDTGELCGRPEKTAAGYAHEAGDYRLTAVFEKEGYGVTSRRDALINTSARPVHLHTVRSVYCFDGAEFEVYVQASGWVHESTGGWQNLTAGVHVQCESVRNASGAAPFAVLWNRQTGRGMAFHLLADASWSIGLTRVLTDGGLAHVEVELGMQGDNLCLELQPGETLAFPEILTYEVRDRVGLDAWKLHHYANSRWPRRESPVMFNSWLYLFSNLSVESVSACIPAAADLGCEYFVIDAGWFGKNPDWVHSIGDWVENENAAFRGQMREVADRVRRAGMKFGLWFEIERALTGSAAAQEHPEHFIAHNGHCFLDFASPAACEYIYGTLDAQIRRCGIEFIKFDFNADVVYDRDRSAFTKYFAGYRAFLARLRREHPEIYLENCASGGSRMTLTNLQDFDSYWFSDNQNPMEGMEIIRNTLLRMPPQLIERWAVVRGVENVRTYTDPCKTKLIATASATWESVVGVSDSMLAGFLTGGPMGFSCDLSTLPAETLGQIREQIARFKRERDFWMKTSCRLLTDTDNLFALQYSDERLNRVIVQVFVKMAMQRTYTAFPALDPAAEYILPDGSVKTGREIDEEGVVMALGTHSSDGNWHVRAIELNKR